MNDKEFIIFLCEQVWKTAAEGREPDISAIKKELELRGINPEDVFVY